MCFVISDACMGEKLLTLFMVLFLALPLYALMGKAGSFTVKGQVLDSLTNESVPYATLRIALASTSEKRPVIFQPDHMFIHTTF